MDSPVGGELGPLALAALLLGSYLLGAVPFALLIGLAKGVDIRKSGSGNVGATNLSRALGRSWGISAFALDFLKGLLPVLAVGWAGGGRPWAGLAEPHVRMAAGAIAILGHVFPVYLRFRGGKGVATSFGALTGLAFWAALAAGAVWLLVYVATRTV